MTNKEISNSYVGASGVDRLYLGGDLVWESTPPGPAPHDYSQDYLTIEANEAGTFYVRDENFDFSKNEGSWTSGIGNTAMTLAQGDKVRFRAANNYSMRGMFSGNTMSFQVYGNIESMEYGDNFSGQTSIHVSSAFSQYFLSSTGLTSAENLVLPATALTSYCYNSMFEGCTSLTQSPVLPDAHGASYCYGQMFSGCTSLSSITCLVTWYPVIGWYFTNWVASVSPTGTFYKHPDMNDWPTGNNGIPSGWTVQDYVAPGQ